MNLVADHRFGQLFITDARPERSKEILSGIEADSRFFLIQNGEISPWNQ